MAKKTPLALRQAVLAVPHDVATALGLLTRLPIPLNGAHAVARGARAAWAYPIVGAGLGAGQGAVFAGAVVASLPVELAAGLAVACGILATGALHEDGLADTADGFWGGWDRARRLEIMKDSRIGTYGVLAVVISVVMRWQAVAALADPALVWPALIAADALSRSAMVALWQWLPPARSAGLSTGLGAPGRVTAGLALLAGMATGAVALPFPSLIGALAAGTAATFWVGRSALSRIGGQTGDVLGATQQVAGVAMLVVIVALAAK